MGRARIFSVRYCARCGCSYVPVGPRCQWCSVECRFWNYVDMSTGPDGCWLWKLGRFKTGYGQFCIDGETLYAHRVALVLSGVKIPDGMYATHGCDNPPCCNPHKKHVRVGSPQMNSIEAHQRGRRDEVNYATGDRHGMRILKLKREGLL